jgi:hypothetical protein
VPVLRACLLAGAALRLAYTVRAAGAAANGTAAAAWGANAGTCPGCPLAVGAVAATGSPGTAGDAGEEG